mgnify:CR=1 FL=1
MTPTTCVFTKESWAGMIVAMHSGEIFEMDQDVKKQGYLCLSCLRVFFIGPLMDPS